MKIARVIAPVVATQKHPSYNGLKTFLVKPLKLDGSAENATFVAIDRVQAGVGDLVLLMQEGSSARFILNDKDAPARSVIVGVIDHMEIEK
ncbi:MAG: EutN/CcmL family microcompartment protein [Candidatus Hydrogenedentes bacterium]|nr:EutN/CcmL family microcompartment protein [Candidatus Hydrogenedentota bacterium]